MRDEWDPGNTRFRKCAQLLLHLKMELEKITVQVIQQSSLPRSEKSRRNKQHFWSRKLRKYVETIVWKRSGNGEKKRQGKCWDKNGRRKIEELENRKVWRKDRSIRRKGKSVVGSLAIEATQYCKIINTFLYVLTALLQSKTSTKDNYCPS